MQKLTKTALLLSVGLLLSDACLYSSARDNNTPPYSSEINKDKLISQIKTIAQQYQDKNNLKKLDIPALLQNIQPLVADAKEFIKKAATEGLLKSTVLTDASKHLQEFNTYISNTLPKALTDPRVRDGRYAQLITDTLNNLKNKLAQNQAAIKDTTFFDSTKKSARDIFNDLFALITLAIPAINAKLSRVELPGMMERSQQKPTDKISPTITGLTKPAPELPSDNPPAYEKTTNQASIAKPSTQEDQPPAYEEQAPPSYQESMAQDQAVAQKPQPVAERPLIRHVSQPQTGPEAQMAAQERIRAMQQEKPKPSPEPKPLTRIQQLQQQLQQQVPQK